MGASLQDSVESMRISEKYRRVRLCELTEQDADEQVCVFGWVAKATPLKKFTFVELASQFAVVKCVLPGSHSLTFSTSLAVRGTVRRVASPKDQFAFEIDAESFEVAGGAPAPSFPLNGQSDKGSVLNYGHLALRLPERALFLRARSELLHVIRAFYHENGYTEVTPPTIVQTQVEGGSTLFSMDYYGERAYLTQSSQLYLETVAPVAGACFCIMPSYRAEKSRTSRHLSEYTHVEGEIVDITFAELMDAIEALFRYAIRGFYERMLPAIRRVHAGFEPFRLADEPFRRLRYADAIAFMVEKDHRKPDGTPYAPLDDICDASERFLVAEYGRGQPVFLVGFPEEHKPFYVSKAGGETESCDLLFPEIGETVGGSMRCHSYEELLAGFVREGLDPKPYGWYLDMARYGPSAHGGYGIGFERLMMGLMHYKNVDEATLYPRKVSRCTP